MIKEVNKKEKRVTVNLPKNAFNVKIKNPTERISDYFSLDYQTPSKNKNVESFSGLSFMFKDFGGRKNYPTSMKIIESTNGIVTIQYN